jgi:hypothetical protein
VTGEGVERLVQYLADQLKTVHGSQIADPKPQSSEPSTVDRQRSTL